MSDAEKRWYTPEMNPNTKLLRLQAGWLRIGNYWGEMELIHQRTASVIAEENPIGRLYFDHMTRRVEAEGDVTVILGSREDVSDTTGLEEKERKRLLWLIASYQEKERRV